MPLLLLHIHCIHPQLIPFDGDANMETNPHISITGTVTKFDMGDRSFTMTPTQYIPLTRVTSPFPIHAHFADSNSKKRWGTDGPKVATGSTVTLGGSLQRVVREHNIDRPLEFAQVEVTNIAYLGTTRGPATTSHTGMFTVSQHKPPALIVLSQLENGSPKNRKRWNWNDLQKSSPDSHSFASSSQSKGKRKRDSNDSDDDEPAKREKTVHDDQKN